VKTIILSAALAVAVPAAAAQFDTTRLFTHGAWQVEHTYDTSDGQVWCSAETSNGAGQVFSMTAYDNGGVVVIVMDPRWSASARPVRFRIDIDYSQWTIDGKADGIAASVSFNADANAEQFITELAQGTTVAVYNEGGTRLAAFSLNGSGAALGALADCWSRIQTHDPFINAADPF
jgi:hypothetical protein